MENGLSKRIVPIGERAICWWSRDHLSENREFLENIHIDYYRELVDTFSESDIDNKCSVQLLLRTLRDQAAEVLFALILSMYQDAYATCIWFSTYTNADLRWAVRQISDGAPLLTSVGEKQITWQNVIEDLFRNTKIDDEQCEKYLPKAVCVFLENLAGAYVDELYYDEYNSIKHGLRAKVTGSKSIQIVKNDSDGSEGERFSLYSGDASITSYSSQRLWSSSLHNVMSKKEVSWSGSMIVAQLCIVNDLISGFLFHLNPINKIKVDHVWSMPADTKVYADCWKAAEKEWVGFSSHVEMASEKPSVTRAELIEILRSRKN